MKTIEQCIKGNKEFLSNLKDFAEKAIKQFEDSSFDVAIFVDKDCKVTKIITGSRFAIWGSSEGLIDSHAYTLNDIINLPG